MKHRFIDERAMIKTELMSSGHQTTLAPFRLQKKRPVNVLFNIISEVSQNRTEKQIMSFKRTVNWLLAYH